jgi:hypothetical protein
MNQAVMIRIANNFWERLGMNSRIPHQSDRFMLWIDAVGGYWVCLRDQIMIGQPGQGGKPDVPILGDLSNRHARLRRDGEGFIIEAIRETWVDGRPVRDVGWLRDGSQIQLGRSVRLLFRRPHALSGTVRLDFLSRHRTQPSADAVLWMADTCILGPKQHSHIVCRNWTREVVLYRDFDALYCRGDDRLEIDGVARTGRGPITRNSRVEGEGFSFNLEAITIGG